ncbi:hypothetical protein Tco_1079446 [Tanacetum coccineum]|uniref:Uncharacterized protein n=1 Tax=Tanacetum coccineum TaxID=301880 RepID=A0ABQ5HRV5_9ASTR
MSLSLAENVIVVGADNRKEHGKLLVDSILNGPFQYGTTVEPINETTPAMVRARTYTDLTDEEKIHESVDIKATNIVLKGLPQDIYNLYQPQVVTQSLVVHQQPYQVSALQQSYQAPAIQQPSSKELDSGLVVPSFNPSDDPIANLNKLMTFGRQTQGYANNGARNTATNKGVNRQGAAGQARQLSVTTVKRKVTLLARAYLDPEQLAFLADNRDTVIPTQASQEILTPAAVQTDDLDAFDFDCDVVPSAKAVLMANLSFYDSDVLSVVPFHDTNIENDMSCQSVYNTPCFQVIDNVDKSTMNLLYCTRLF